MATKERVRIPAGREMIEKATKVMQAVAPALPANREPTSMLAVIARAAADPACDVQKMQALLDMQRQIEEREAIKAFTSSFMQLQHDIPAIRRDGKIEIREKDGGGQRSGRVQQSTPYATFNAIMKAVAKPLKKNGFALSFATEPSADGARIIVRGILDHEGGHQRTTSFPLPAETSGSKNNVQGWGSSMSYGKRYCTIALLNIVSEAPEDRDTDGTEGNFKAAKGGVLIDAEPVKKITSAQANTLWKKMEACGVKESNFLQHYGLTNVQDLGADLFDVAVMALEAHKAKRDAAQNG
jgi:hypothetical protein